MKYNFTEEAKVRLTKDEDEIFNISYDEFGNFLDEDKEYEEIADIIIEKVSTLEKDVKKSFSNYLKRYIDTKTDKFLGEDDVAFIQRKQDERKHINGKKDLLSKQRIEAALSNDTFMPKRDYVFRLAFILGMKIDEVNEFLIKGMKDRMFNFKNPIEVIYWYCLRNGYGFQKAQGYIGMYNSLHSTEMDGSSYTVDVYQDFFSRLIKNPSEELLGCLSELKSMWPNIYEIDDNYKYFNQRINSEFADSYNEVRKSLKKQFELTNLNAKHVESFGDKYKDKNKKYDFDIEAGPSGICRYLYETYQGKEVSVMKKEKIGLPKSLTDNRITDMLIDGIVNGGKEASRQHLITMRFLEDQRADIDVSLSPKERLEDFVDSMNNCLDYICGLQPLSPNNPYDYFIMLCMCTDDPLYTFQTVYKRAIANKEK